MRAAQVRADLGVVEGRAPGQAAEEEQVVVAVSAAAAAVLLEEVLEVA